jgi:hypothetical protein
MKRMPPGIFCTRSVGHRPIRWIDRVHGRAAEPVARVQRRVEEHERADDQGERGHHRVGRFETPFPNGPRRDRDEPVRAHKDPRDDDA